MSAPSAPAPASWHKAAAGAALSVGGAALVYALRRSMGSSSSRQREQADLKNRLVRQQSQSKSVMTRDERHELREKKRAERLERAYTECCRRREVVLEVEIGDVTVREFAEVRSCRGVPLLEGFPASGLSSSLTANYLVSQLELPLVGEMVSDAFPALGVVSRYTASSGCRIYGDERLVVFVTDFKIEEKEGAVSVIGDLVDAVYDFADRHGCPLILTCEGLARTSSIKKSDYETQEELLMAMLEQMNEQGVAEEEQEEIKAALEEKARLLALEKLKEREDEDDETSGEASPSPTSGSTPAPEQKEQSQKKRKKKHKKKHKKKNGEEDTDSEDEPEDGEIRFVSNDAGFALRMKELGHAPLKEGMLNGVTGGILARASTVKQTVVCLLSPYDEALPDASASIPLIECIDAILGSDIEIDTTDLAREVRHIERELRKAIEEMVPKSGVTTKDRHMSMYM